MRKLIVFGSIGLISIGQYWIRMGVPTTTQSICIPASAIDYDGRTNSWLDKDGEVVLYSIQEDTYERCSQ